MISGSDSLAADEEMGDVRPIGGGMCPDGPFVDTGEWVAEQMARMRDPRADLTPTARRVLSGAEQVILEKGFGKLTLANISKASDENVAAVKYYFGNKAGLVRVLLEAVTYDVVSALAAAPDDGLSGAHLGRLAAETGRLNRPTSASRIFFDILPHAMRDPALLERVWEYYRTFFRLHLDQLRAAAGVDPASAPQLNGLASLLSAIGDGLTLQAMIAPDTFDMSEALAALDVLLQHGLPAFNGDTTNSPASR
jgi:AcrR family transcriptional regulator